MTEQWELFHMTVRGQLHVLNNIPCEDFSGSFSDPQGRYEIAALSDGHGAKECFRSAKGSAIAVDVAVSCLREFADTLLALTPFEQETLFRDGRNQEVMIRRLTDTILAMWNDRVREDFEAHPVQEDEPKKPESFPEEFTSHIYGATLIAGLRMPQGMLLLQQGDGRCVVMTEDGAMTQPIPWDERCQDTMTTSLCDEDAAERFRSVLIPFSETEIAGCFFSSDGVEDAYRDTYEGLGSSHALMGGVHTFFQKLLLQKMEQTPDEFDRYLEEFLPEFSACGQFGCGGSGDDVSVAGLVQMEKVLSLKDQLAQQVKIYELEENLFWQEDMLATKQRKHGILQKRKREAVDKFLRAQQSMADKKQRIEQLEREIDVLTQDVEQIPAETYDDLCDYLRSFREFLWMSDVLYLFDRNRIDYRRLQQRIQNCEKALGEIKEALEQGQGVLEKLAEEKEQAEKKFENYDKTYREIEARRQEIVEKLKACASPYTQRSEKRV